MVGALDALRGGAGSALIVANPVLVAACAFASAFKNAVNGEGDGGERSKSWPLVMPLVRVVEGRPSHRGRPPVRSAHGPNCPPCD